MKRVPLHCIVGIVGVIVFLSMSVAQGEVTVAPSKLVPVTQTITLNVKNMTCAVCPITVKKALQQVPGVTQTQIDFKEKTATVTFNPQKTSANALIAATKKAGYSSTPAKRKIP